MFVTIYKQVEKYNYGIYDDIVKLKAAYERVNDNVADQYDIYFNNPNTKLTIEEFDRDNEKFMEVKPELLWAELNTEVCEMS